MLHKQALLIISLLLNRTTYATPKQPKTIGDTELAAQLLTQMAQPPQPLAQTLAVPTVSRRIPLSREEKDFIIAHPNWTQKKIGAELNRRQSTISGYLKGELAKDALGASALEKRCKKLTPQEKERIRALRAAGSKEAAIAQELGRALGTIYSFLRNDHPKGRAPLSSTTKEEIAELFSQGMSPEELGEKYHCHAATVRSYLRGLAHFAALHAQYVAARLLQRIAQPAEADASDIGNPDDD